MIAAVFREHPATTSDHREVQMRPVSCATRHIFLVFTVYGAVGATIAAATDADAPTKVRTLSTKPQSPEEHHDATLSPELPSYALHRHDDRVEPR